MKKGFLIKSFARVLAYRQQHRGLKIYEIRLWGRCRLAGDL